MKLRDVSGRYSGDDGFDELVAAELEAIDATLRGEPVDATMAAIADLTRDVRAVRSEPDPAFSAALDEWAAAGFPRESRPRSAAPAPAPRRRLRLPKLSVTSPAVRRTLAFGGVTAAIVLAVIGLAQYSGGGDDDDQGDSGATATEDIAAERREEATTSSSATTADSTGEAAPAGDSAAAPEATADALDGRASAGATDGDVGTYARSQSDRQVERDAQLKLAAPPEDVADVAGEAMDVTESFGGIVMSSRVTGTAESARASLRLAIPSKNLGAALADLSDLAEVRSRSEQSDDITQPYTSAEEVLAGLEAQRQSILEQLAAADTAEQEEILQIRLDGLDDQIAETRSEFQQLARSARMADVQLEISSTSSDDEADGDWGIDDAIDEAGSVITTVAGILLIAAAVVVPLALVALAGLLIWRAARQKARERALDD